MEFNDFYKVVAKNVRMQRELQNISQLEMSRKMNFESSSFYAAAENACSNKRFNLIHLFKISEILGVSVSELMSQSSQKTII